LLPIRFRRNVVAASATVKGSLCARTRMLLEPAAGIAPRCRAPRSAKTDGHQHESDQLDGIFWIRRLSSLKRDQVIRRYQKLQRAG